MFDTPYTRARCNSMLTFIQLYGRLFMQDVEDIEVARKLLKDHKVILLGANNPYLVVVDPVRYTDDNTCQYGPHPVVLELAAENPANEEFVRIYRKNGPLTATI